jgi:hypothetical protein
MLYECPDDIDATGGGEGAAREASGVVGRWASALRLSRALPVSALPVFEMAAEEDEVQK